MVALAIFVGIGLLFHAQTYASPAGTEVATVVGTSTVNGVSMQHVTLAFNTYPDASGSHDGVAVHPGGNSAWPTYGPTNQFQVPAHALVTVTIRQYDSGGSLNNPWFDKVRGTYNDHVLTFDLHMPTWPFFAVAWGGDLAAVVLIAVRAWNFISGRGAP